MPPNEPMYSMSITTRHISAGVVTMPAPDEFFEDLREQLLSVETPDDRDALLDEWFDAANRATDYDAIEWGFDPKRWMSEDRKRMEVRIAEARAERRRAKAASREERAQG